MNAQAILQELVDYYTLPCTEYDQKYGRSRFQKISAAAMDEVFGDLKTSKRLEVVVHDEDGNPL